MTWHRSGAVHVAQIYPALQASPTILNQYVHTHSQMHTFLHSCGSIYQLLPDLIEAVYEVINRVQITARDMEPERLKREFGQDITFWGGGCEHGIA